MNNKIILDLCGGTGAWSEPYRRTGYYEVWNLTLPEFDICVLADLLEDKFIPHGIRNEEFYYTLRHRIKTGMIYGILAAPPCTQFSIARRSAKTDPDYRGAMKIVEACERIIREASIAGGLKFWAIENPRGKLRNFIGIPRNTFYQWQFGGQHKKPSDVWGYYNAPTPKVKKEPKIDVDKTWQNPVCPPEYKHLKLNRQAVRAITPAGFAKAFYGANK